MADSFTCPHTITSGAYCNAPLEHDSKATSVRCPYCANTVIIPDSLREPVSPPPERDPLVKDPALLPIAALLREGKRVQATIRDREVSGAVLRQAQIAIEQYLSGYPLERPR